MKSQVKVLLIHLQNCGPPTLYAGFLSYQMWFVTLTHWLSEGSMQLKCLVLVNFRLFPILDTQHIEMKVLVFSFSSELACMVHFVDNNLELHR